jgi:hypothetical protein
MALVLDYVNDSNYKHGGSMLDGHTLTLKLQAELDAGASREEARLQAESDMPSTSTVKARNSESVALDHVGNDQ